MSPTSSPPRPARAARWFQDTWVRVLERGRQYDGRSPFVPWLLSVARHLAIDHLRRPSPLSLDVLSEDGTGERASIDEQRSPFREVAAEEERARLGELMALLPAIHREVLLLRFQEELTRQEISTLVGAPLATVKSRLYRALESTRRIWGEAR